MKRLWLVAGAAIAGLLAGAFAVTRPDLPRQPRRDHLPSSIAALGDSITAGVGAVPGALREAPEHTWATGDADDRVVSHYERLVAVNPEIQSRSYNLAVPGATMRDGAAQARRAVAADVEYVTILLGANDVCASSVAAMTSRRRFERDFRRTLHILRRGLSEARIFVASIPDIHRLWELFRHHPAVLSTWQSRQTCASMLASDGEDAMREQARARLVAYNRVLKRVCTEHHLCRFDDHAVFEFDFGSRFVASDFFHPSQLGHRVLARLTWKRSHWPEL